MQTRRIGIILNGVTGRMGARQHLERSICAIIKEGGIPLADGSRLVPDPLLTGRNEEKLKELAELRGNESCGNPFRYGTDLDVALKGDDEIFFDASTTSHRAGFVEKAIHAGKAIYCEKPTATGTAEALRLARLAEAAGVKNGVVQDKLWLPGIRKLRGLRDRGFFGRVLSVRGDFGYWVFTGLDEGETPQRPSWNYRAEDGGGMMSDMFCHWQYVLSDLFSPVKSLVAYGATDLPERRDESGRLYPCTADDSAYAIFILQDGAVAQFNSSWTTRVRRDDLLTIQVDGTRGSAVAGLRDVFVQGAGQTPRPVWNPDEPQPIDFYSGWERVPEEPAHENAFKLQWEAFLRHVVSGSEWKYTLREGARGVQLAELGMQSWKQRSWLDVPELEV